MRNKAVLFVLALLVPHFASCDSGEKKAAFDRYEGQVSQVLEQEAELRTQYEDEYANMQAYRRLEAFDLLVRKKVIPFYEEMEKTVGSVNPDGEDLSRIHGMLVEYVALSRELFSLDTRTAKVAEMEKPALERLNAAMSVREKATGEFNDALLSLPDLMQKLAPIFTTEQQAALSVVQYLQSVRGGERPAAEFLKYMDEQVDPYYQKLVRTLAEMPVGPAEQAAMLKAKAYVGSTMAFFIAAREMAAIRPIMDEQLVPLRERLLELQERTAELILDYRLAAREYRDGLR